MNKSILLMQILSCKSIKTYNNHNRIIKLKARFLKRKNLAVVNVIVWNKKSLEMFNKLKKFDYIIAEGKLHRNEKTVKNFVKNQRKDLTFSASHIIKYKSLLKNKDVDLFIK